MKKTKEIEPSAIINQDEIPKSKFFLIVEKLSKITLCVCYGVDLMTPSLFYLDEKYPKVIDFMIVQSTLIFITLLILVVYLFLLWKNGLLKKQNKKEPKRCSKVICSHCTARRQHPKWFKLKHLLQLLGTLTFAIYSVMKIDYFFETDQTVDLYRLSQLFGWQLSAICSSILFAFYGKQLSLHNGPLQVNDDGNEKDAMLGMRVGQQV